MAVADEIDADEDGNLSLIVLATPEEKLGDKHDEYMKENPEFLFQGPAYSEGASTTYAIKNMENANKQNVDFALASYAKAEIAGMIWDDLPDADGLKGPEPLPIDGREVSLYRVLATGADADDQYDGATYHEVANTAITMNGERPVTSTTYDWGEPIATQTVEGGAYRFTDLDVCDESGTPYLYRVETAVPEGGDYVPINALEADGQDDNDDDSDFGASASDELTATTVAYMLFGGEKDEMGETGMNAYGRKHNLTIPYNWTPETERPVDFGVYIEDPTGDNDDRFKPKPRPSVDPPKELGKVWKDDPVMSAPYDPITGEHFDVPNNPLGYNPGFFDRIVNLPQTSDPLQVSWLLLSSMFAALVVFVLIRKRRDEEDEEDEVLQEMITHLR